MCSKPPLSDLSLPVPCTHEEADSLMLLHASHVASYDHHKIIIRTVNIDVAVLAVLVTEIVQQENELWITFGTGKGLPDTWQATQ
jgi:hypothetical protein